MTHTVHDFQTAAAHVARHKDPEARATAFFDTTHQMIHKSLVEAHAAPDKAAAIKVFEDNYNEATKHRDAIIAKLAS